MAQVVAQYPDRLIGVALIPTTTEQVVYSKRHDGWFVLKRGWPTSSAHSTYEVYSVTHVALLIG